MKRVLLALAAAALLVPLAPAQVGAPRVEDLVLTVEGEAAHGLVARPSSGDASSVVLVLHGYGHQAESHRGHLQRLAELGAAAVAMDYRGDVEGFPLAAGAQDSCAALAMLRSENPGVPTYLYSVSMGTAVAALVIPACGPFDAWVDNEGLAMLAETWAEATLVAPAIPFGATAAAAIEAECGGTPADAPECYLARSAALQASAFDVGGVVITHGLNDGLVPYNQGREMAAALRAAGVPTAFYTVARGEVGGEGTSITGHGGQQVDGLAGHGTESDDAHTLTALSFGVLYDIVASGVVPTTDSEHVVDREFGTLP